MRTVTAVAHRGDPYRVRENTIDSLRSALQLGADAVEIDVRLTRDEVPVLLHDETLKRLWELERPLSSLSSDEVRGLTGGGVPTLVEALEATEDSRIMVDLPGEPDGTAVRRIIEVIRECGAPGPGVLLRGRRGHARGARRRPGRRDRADLDEPAPPRPALLDGGAAALAQLPLLPGGPRARPPASTGAATCSPSGPPTPAVPCAGSSAMGVDSITTNRIDALCALRKA